MRQRQDELKLHRVKAKLNDPQKEAVAELQRAMEREDENRRGWPSRVTEQDVVIRGLVLLCKKYGVQWPTDDDSAKNPAQVPAGNPKRLTQGHIAQPSAKPPILGSAKEASR